MIARSIRLISVFIAAFLMISSVIDDSPVNDEPEHIFAGFSYLKFHNLLLNPFHPPLVKDLIAIPLILGGFKAPVFDTVKGGAPGQVLGLKFLFSAGNSADDILLYSRLVSIFISVLFLILFGWWVASRYGEGVGTISVAFLAFSPTFIAHSRYVLTDVPAAIAIFGSLLTLGWCFDNGSRKRFVILGIVFGLSFLTKFSSLILIPLSLVLLLIRAVLMRRNRFVYFKRNILGLLGAGALSMFIVTLVYGLQIGGLRGDFQYKYMEWITPVDPFGMAHTLALFSPTRGLAWFLTGVLSQFRNVRGDTQILSYVAGELYDGGRAEFFPILFVTKESLPFLFGIFASIAVGAAYILKAIRNGALSAFLLQNFTLFSFTILSAIYFGIAMLSGLNVGLRHLLPIYPPLAVCAAVVVWKIIDLLPRYKKMLLGGFILWCFLISFNCWPYYVSYFNPLGGGIQGGHAMGLDSNFDWGQDLKRLSYFVKENQIPKVYLNYFGSGDPKYYLGDAYHPFKEYDPKFPGNVAMSVWPYIKIARSSEDSPTKQIVQGLAENQSKRVGSTILFWPPPAQQ